MERIEEVEKRKLPVCGKCGRRTTKYIISQSSFLPKFFCPKCNNWLDRRWDKLIEEK